MAKPDLGTKRQCAHCGAKFYDLNHAPAACPKCSTVFEAAAVTARGRPEPARASREVEPAMAESQEAEFVSLEEADAEVHGTGKKKPAAVPADGDEDVEIDDEGMDEDAFIEEPEEEDTDVTEIIGNDIENEEET